MIIVINDDKEIVDEEKVKEKIKINKNKYLMEFKGKIKII